jgi:hypothetical protein
VTDYSREWKGYRVRRNLAAIAVFGMIPFVFLLSVIPQSIPWVEPVKSVLLVAWFFGFIYVAIWSQSFPCPRCGEYFCRKWWYNKSFFAEKCVHCGLEKYSNG